MKLNKKLLPMKAHYFLFFAGCAPIFPFMPLILRDLGFSSISVGWVFTAYPLLTIVCKPLLGTIADKFRCHRFLLLVTLFLQLIMMFGIQWSPGLPSKVIAELICDGNIRLRVCSQKLTESHFKSKLVESFNSSFTCKVEFENWNKRLTTEKLEKDAFFDTGYDFENEVEITFGPSYSIKKNCLVTEIFNFLPKNTSNYTRECGINIPVVSNIDCGDTTIMELMVTPSVAEDEQMATIQFWIAFALVITARITGSVVQSFSDAFCFILLGDKPERYGTQRMWGAVSWGLCSFISGFLVDKVSKGLAKKNFLTSYYILLVLLLFDIIVALNMKVKFAKKSKNIMKDIKHFFKSLRICIFMFWCFLGGVYCSVIWNFLFWFIEDLAASNPDFDMTWIKTLEGLVLAVQCYLGEIPFFFFSGWILKQIGPPKAMIIVLFCYGARFLIYSFLTNPWWILPIEILNGITFGLFYSTMVTYASSISPIGTEATVQNIVGSVFEGAGVAVGSLLGGYLFKKVGSSQALFVFGTSALTFSFLYLFLQAKLLTKDEKAEEAVEAKDKEIYGEELQKLKLSS